MTAGQLETIEEIFHAALERAPAEVDAFLDSACEGDKLLRRQVEALLAFHRRAGTFIETPAVALATQILENGPPDRLAGQRIGHYELCHRIGAGGMGEVYLANDLTAGRKAALKLLPARHTSNAERVKRFEREARAVVALNHPNILTVYEIGEHNSAHYIASELIDGETLRQRLGRGPMKTSEALEVATQVASALVAAHGAGIVHRDIKPENIMLRPDGYVKVLDFGIAKLAEEETPAPADGENAKLGATRLGSTVGTARYMSPEQVLGGSIDQRSDIWSLGVVLYEMITGRAPFNGEKPGEVMTAILETELPPLPHPTAEAPEELRQIIAKTLRKESAERYPNASELLEALKAARRQLELNAASQPRSSSWPRWTRAAAALVLIGLGIALAFPYYWHRKRAPSSPPPEKSIAVLPFENLSDNKENAYFAAGVQEEILSNLARIADLKVISRTSTRIYEAGQPRNSRQIGRELGVAHLLEGSVQRAGDHLRIHAQLIDTRTDSHRWAQTYDRRVADLFSIQSEIAQTIAGQLQTEISTREKAAMARPPTTDLVANDLYAEATALEREAKQPDLLKAVNLLQQAVARDPQFYLAYCALGRIHLAFFSLGYDRSPARLGMAEGAIQKAAQLQPEAGEAHLVQAEYFVTVLDDYDRARAELELARRTLPNSPAVYAQLAYIDRRQGRWTEAVRNLERAVDLDPRNVAFLIDAAGTYSMIRHYSKAVELGRRATTLTPRYYFARLFVARQVVAERADLGPLRRELDTILVEDPAAAPKIADTLLECAMLERDVAAADRALAAIPPEGISVRPGLIAPHEWWVGQVALVAHRPEAARAAFETARTIFEKVVREEPENTSAWSLLGRAEAALGRKEEAIRAGRRACQLLPLSTEPFAGLRPLRDLAKIYVAVGEKDLALELMTTSAALVIGFDYGDLKLDFDWDPLRGDPRFEQIVASLAPK